MQTTNKPMSLDQRLVNVIMQSGDITPDIDPTDKKRYPPLLHAAHDGDVALVKELVKCGAPISERNQYGLGVLHLSYQSPALLKFFISLGCEVDARTRDGDTPLMSSSGHDALESATILLDAGANINTLNFKGETAMTRATVANRIEIMRLLLARGANVHFRGRRGKSLLDEAIIQENIKPAQFLEMIGVNSYLGARHHGLAISRFCRKYLQKNYRDSILFPDGKPGRTKLTPELLIAIHERLNEKPTLLFTSIERGDYDVIEKLLKCEVNLEARDDYGDTPLKTATWHGQFKIVELLIRAGANVNARNNNGGTPLMDAAHEGHTALAKLLLENGAKVNLKSQYDGSTALIEAAGSGKMPIVRMLVEYGAHIKAKDVQGSTAAYWAREWGNEDLARFLDRAA